MTDSRATTHPASPAPSPSVKERDDRALLAAVGAGDEDAMMELVRRFGGELYRVALRVTGRREDAEEAVQDAFLQVLRKARTFEGRAAVRTWIYSIALNAARMRRRSQARHTEREVATIEDYFRDDGAYREQVISFALPDQGVLSDEARATIAAALGKIPALDRTIVVLADQEDMTAREISAVLGLTEPAVKSRLHRARMALRGYLADYFRSPDIASSHPHDAPPRNEESSA